LEKLKDDIAEELYTLLQQNKQPNGNEKIASILKTLPQQDKCDFMESLNKTEPETARQVETYLHNWNDISKLSGEKIKILLKYCDKDVMLLALSESNVQIQAAIARQLPTPLWDNMLKQMKQLTTDDKKQSAFAQQTILKTAQDLKLFN
jgi:flagellar motor switch protein FliG